MASAAWNLRVLSLVPGRVRLRLPGWTAGDAEPIEARLSRVAGVEDVQANPLTGNVLVRFECRSTSAETLLAKLQEAWDELFAADDSARNGRGPSTSSLVRVGVRGLLGHAAVDSLWFAAGFLGEAVGLPLAGLGPLHVLLDIAVLGAALGSAA
jgi:hypothetical protein